MLRLALIENLHRVAARLAIGRCDHDSAFDWVEKMLRVVEQNPTNLVLVLADMGESNRAWDLFSLINPIHHGDTPQHQSTYYVEPYVVAADVYAIPSHTDRGGWTRYTGSDGWMYRLITESLLGLHLEVDKLHCSPLFQEAWHSFKIHFRFRNTFYHIDIHNAGTGNSVKGLSVDDVEPDEKSIATCRRWQ